MIGMKIKINIETKKIIKSKSKIVHKQTKIVRISQIKQI